MVNLKDFPCNSALFGLVIFFCFLDAGKFCLCMVPEEGVARFHG